MSIWALADLHLALAVPDKTMEIFGEPWIGYIQKIETNWRKNIAPDDLVLLAGDISWALRLNEAKIDLNWIHQLPGTKVMIRGNHDYWWTSLRQLQTILPPSIHLIQNNALPWKGTVIGGTRLWDTSEYSFDNYVEYKENPKERRIIEKSEEPDNEKIFLRELGRLEMSLKEMAKFPGKRIVMTHYPPIGADLQPSRVSQMLEKYQVDSCVFGHVHNIPSTSKLFGEARGVKYYLTAGDYLNFVPLKIG